MQLVAMRNNPNHKRNQIQACLQISDGLNNTFCFLIGDLRSRSDPVLVIRNIKVKCTKTGVHCLIVEIGSADLTSVVLKEGTGFGTE